MTSQSFANSYILTTRDRPTATSKSQTFPLPNGALWWYTAPEQYDPEVTAYMAVGLQPSASPPPAFLAMLESDLQIAIANGFPQLTVVIHGLANLFSTSVGELASAGAGLQQYAQYYGLVISFDWPSYDQIDSIWPPNYAPLPYRFPPSTTSGTIRGNINGSVQAFGTLISMLDLLRQKFGIAVNIICHSEGNYMMMLGMQAQLTARQPVLNQVLLVAADINNGALLPSSNTPPDTGQGAPIATLSQQVTIYYSSGDDVLPWSKDFLALYHDPSYRDRLGLEGPSSYPSLLPRTCGVDCSAVVSDAVIQQIPQVPPGTSAHSSYFYIPQVLQDWAQTLQGTAPANVINRAPVVGRSNAFTMRFVPPPPLVNIREALRSATPPPVTTADRSV
jgi:esterase/lipase superfamily enzyme